MFNVGDRVRVVDEGERTCGMIGTIRHCQEDNNNIYAVEFDNPDFDGHDCGGYVPSGRGKFQISSELELITEEEEEIAFQIGDRVRVVNGYPSLEGREATIVDMNGDSRITLEFDEADLGLHDAGGATRNNRGWFVCYWNIELVERAEQQEEEQQQEEEEQQEGVDERVRRNGKWKKEDIWQKIEESDLMVRRSIVILYKLQTTDEQQVEGTAHKNNLGFNKPDAKFLTSLAKKVINEGVLTKEQYKWGRKALKKYCGQLVKVANGKIEVSAKEIK